MMEQDPWKSARAEFDAIPLPEELNDRVLAGIREGQFRRKRRRLGRMLGTCAACFVLLLGVLNLSPTAAKAAADLPGVGGVRIEDSVIVKKDGCIPLTSPTRELIIL